MSKPMIVGFRAPAPISKEEAAQLREEARQARISATYWEGQYRRMAQINREEAQIRQAAREALLEKQEREAAEAKRPSTYACWTLSFTFAVMVGVWLAKML